MSQSMESTVHLSSSLLPGFTHRRLRTTGADINYAVGGRGPPLLLLHGNPLTHVSWHKVAPSLAERFTVVIPDLRGYGDSSKPDGGEDHSAYSFRAMAQDNVEVMRSLGFDRFQVAGHDRGARVAFRMALDAPKAVSRLAALDIVPTYELLSDVTLGWGLESYHWFFMAQKAPFPERLIGADLDYYIDYKLNKKGVGLSIFDPRAFASTSVARRMSRSTPYARTIARRSRSTIGWMRRTGPPGVRSTAPSWCSGAATAMSAGI